MARIGVLTSGGDAPGMNAAVRAVVRTALNGDAEVFTIYEGFQGLLDGGEQIRSARWSDVSSILELGGTALGTVRCKAFRERSGRLLAARNLLRCGIDRLVVIGGDGSLTGAMRLAEEWASLGEELVANGEIAAMLLARHPTLRLVGLVGSIDNDIAGMDMTIGADTALHRITEAMDALSSTARSHRRTFIVEVMGRKCGYLALMAGLSGGADYVFLPEDPPPAGEWERHMIAELVEGRDEGRRNPVIVLSEGACDSAGNPITAEQVKEVVALGFGGEVRVTVLGHVQRGGAPSAFDRNLGTILGHAAAQALLDGTVGDAPVLIGMRGNRVVHVPLAEALAQNGAVVEAIRAGDYPLAMKLRGNGFLEGYQILRTMLQTRPSAPAPASPTSPRLRLAVLNAGAPAAGMNAAVRAAVRIGLDQGHEVLGVDNGFQGLIEGHLRPLGWMDVTGWVSRGGSELGARRTTLVGKELYAIARTLEKERIDGLLVIGGWTAYVAAHAIHHERGNYPACDIPIVCLPATIDNNLPGSELSIGADSALNSIVWALDRIRLSASAQRRCFVVEVMGRRCGYLAMMSALASGAERAYLHEHGVTVADLLADVEALKRGFAAGRRLGLVIRNEMANAVYDARFMGALYEEESGDLFDVRVAILGHLQQGGAPTPYDRIHATHLAAKCIVHLIAAASGSGPRGSAFVGLDGGTPRFWDLQDFPRMVDLANERPRAQWWLALEAVAEALGRADRGTAE